ncbi:ribonuclease III [Candidatus Curtissbacteria bacterium RIFCSPHIGHO2_01_FULL_41_44]|uniref:Ribonuclease 3 n=1 Tax=Candidatus Curtissbacteria bacterium RIFCSPLOWO2_01_FULL_42_50 TaxID=1797730 RepID=A0A1F5H7T1_9BACT|nr:MAG: ribonuclease III [Candidatus Curtissbacteria bacterium RIFCSPHIGHO2_01_FULL_41_44]OGD94254.1 MAG: ribonuclease III [Candidatus Curtissbacteria bacterium RIFCSPHIGHO2_02_FULL_42_58]OGD97728.1 MAG: ribonuclease III [Candidatus Curtissbacteria bacterium RIFCSPHIGHO2_12_FULL_42_33]OGE00120.1 MAG: ribonuclease III [Candidatus Curtissbacteria bacterium RIFCSPLOWO2_01_FULL_42_50]OGE02046.1 MAG: ribonuclease III [Candidatus Curtissbacteria bacterium RIFCSPLOWO2_12_FULL_41_16]OGE09791.1 MAG: ri
MSTSQADITNIQELINLNFRNEKLLKNAFIHRSYLNEHKEFKGASNERLEFLGDAVLSLAVSKFLYEKFQKSPEGQLTQQRSALVRTETLAKVARTLSLGKYLYLSRGEEESGGRNNRSILANTFEALVGAIYLDLGFDQAQNFLEQTILKKWRILAKTAVVDNKSKLQEIVQRKYHESPTYKLIKSWGPDHARQFQVGVLLENSLLGLGEGPNKQIAAQNAARNAIAKIKTTDRLELPTQSLR